MRNTTRRGLSLLLLLALLLAGCGGQPVTITIDGEPRLVRSSGETVAAVLDDAGILVRAADQVTPALHKPLDADRTITIVSAPPVTVTLNEVSVPVYTHANTVRDVLLAAGHTPGAGDAVLVDDLLVPAEQWDSPLTGAPRNIEVTTAFVLTVIDGDTRHTITSSAATLGRALSAAGIALREADGVTPPLWTPLTADLTVEIDRASPLTVTVDGQTMNLRSHGSTVADALNALGIALGPEDYSAPPLDAPLPDSGEIRVVRVTTELITTEYAIDYSRRTEASDELPLDQVALLQAGQPGLQAEEYAVRYEDGVEVSREMINTWQVLPPQDEVIGYGTQINVQTTQTADGPIEYWRAATFYAVSYSPSRSGTSPDAPWYGRTRTGKILQQGMIAVDPNVIPLGTRMYIPGYGFATAEDTGGGVVGRLIDLGYEDHNYVPWHENVTVYFLTPIPPADQIIWILPE